MKEELLKDIKKELENFDSRQEEIEEKIEVIEESIKKQSRAANQVQDEVLALKSDLAKREDGKKC